MEDAKFVKWQDFVHKVPLNKTRDLLTNVVRELYLLKDDKVKRSIELIKTCVLKLNELDIKYSFIGTIEREDIYEILLNRFDLKPQHCVFIDDSKDNVEGAEKAGIKGIHYKNSEQLRNELQLFRLLP